MTPYDGSLSELVIDLDAVARNWLALKSRLQAGADCAAVVKADAYGLGATRVSRKLYNQGCRHFFVAHATEAAEITPTLVDAATMATADRARIYLLNGPWVMAAQDMVAAGFIPVLNSLEDLRYWAGMVPGAAAILHIDTGMNRLGLSLDDLAAPDLADLLAKIDLRYVMSHLACADAPAHPLNALQRDRLNTAARLLKRPVRLSLANSAGILLGGDYHYDMVRPGCALYGINPAEGPNPMQGVVELKARIVQLRQIAAGETVGYGASYTVPPAQNNAIKTYATLSLGYADGFLRSLSGRGAVVIGGVVCPLVGRVSMDSVVADVSHLPQLPVTGDWVEVIGPHQLVDTVAEMAGTIGYEILTSLGRRYRRIYKGTDL